LFILLISSASAAAAGIDSRAYTCGDLHNLIARTGFVFISQPAFGDFVVAGPYYCGGGEMLRLRSVPTLDRPECTVNYCESRGDFER
jgi:hypothetical protein